MKRELPLKAEPASPRRAKVEAAVKREPKNSPKREPKISPKDEKKSPKDEKKVKPDVKPSQSSGIDALLQRGLKIREDQARRAKSEAGAAGVKLEGKRNVLYKSKKRVSAKKRNASRVAMNRPVKLSDEFAELLGAPALSRPEAVSRLWAHCRERGMVNPENKREVFFDDHLSGLLGRPSSTMLGMNGLLNPHFDFTTPVPEPPAVKLKRGKQEAKPEAKTEARTQAWLAAKREAAAPVLLKPEAAVPASAVKRDLAKPEPNPVVVKAQKRDSGAAPEPKPVRRRELGGEADSADAAHEDPEMVAKLEQALLPPKRDPAAAVAPPPPRRASASGGGQPELPAKRWAQQQVLQWCASIQAPQLAGIVRDYSIDGITLLALCEDDLRLLGLTSGLLLKRILEEKRALGAG